MSFLFASQLNHKDNNSIDQQITFLFLNLPIRRKQDVIQKTAAAIADKTGNKVGHKYLLLVSGLNRKVTTH